MKQRFDMRYVQDSMLTPEDMESLDATLYAPKEKERVARQILPIKSDDPAWAESVAYKKYESSGAAEIVYGNGDDLPTVKVDDSKTTSPVVTLAFSYIIDKLEIAAARATGVPIEDTKVVEVRKGMASKEETILFQGDDSANLSGLCDYGASVTLDNGDWVTGTSDAQKIVEDIHQMWVSVSKQDGLQANTLLLSNDAWEVANTKYFTSSGPRQSAFDEIMDKGWFDGIYKTDELAAGVNDMMVLDNSQENMAAVIPQDVQRLDPNESNLYYQVPVMERLGGVIVRYDSSGSYAVKYPDSLTLT